MISKPSKRTLQSINMPSSSVTHTAVLVYSRDNMATLFEDESISFSKTPAPHKYSPDFDSSDQFNKFSPSETGDWRLKDSAAFEIQLELVDPVISELRSNVNRGQVHALEKSKYSPLCITNLLVW